MKRQTFPKLGFRLRAELARPDRRQDRYDVVVWFADQAAQRYDDQAPYVVLALSSDELHQFAMNTAIREVELATQVHPLNSTSVPVARAAIAPG